jgi:hypothetical protein
MRYGNGSAVKADDMRVTFGLELLSPKDFDAGAKYLLARGYR